MNLSDRQLANFAYAQQKIPPSEWAAHYEIDLMHSALGYAARSAYRAIYASVYKEAKRDA